MAIERARVEAVTDFLFLGSNITADGDCNHEIRRWLLLGRKVMTNLDSVLKCRNITLPTKVCQKVLTKTYSQGYGLPIGHIRLWALDRKAGRTPKNWCLWTVVLKKTLENPLDSKRSNQSILGRSTLNIHWKDWYWSWSSSYFGHLMCTDNLMEKSLMLGKIEGRRRRGHQRMR